MPTRRRRPLAPLASVGVAALLLTGLAAGSASAAEPDAGVSAADGSVRQATGSASPGAERRAVSAAVDPAAQVLITGTIELSGVDEAHPVPTGAAYRVVIENQYGEVVATVDTEQTFSVTVTGSEEYYVLAQVIDDASWYPTWSGDTPIPAAAASIDVDPATGVAAPVEITLPRTTSAGGTITAAAVSGVADTDFVLQSWWYEDSTDTIYKLDETTKTDVVPGAPVAWTSGDESLPVGRYVFRLAEPGAPSYDDQYFSRQPRLTDRSITPLPAAGRTDVAFTPVGFGSNVARIQGDDRYATAVEVTRSSFTDAGIPVLYVASGEKWPDALSAGPAASAQGGALLLTDPNRLFPVVSAEITRLAPEKIVVVGSDLSVSDAVFASIDAVSDAETVRIEGSDRYETSRLIVEDAFDPGTYQEVFLPTGGNFPDALSVAPIAGRYDEPVLLVDGAEPGLDSATLAAIERLDPVDAVLIGGLPSISAGIQNDLVASGLASDVSRIAGSDRHDTSRLLNDAFPPFETTDSVFLATAENSADALAVGPAAASIGAPLYLSETTCVPRATRVEMQEHSLDYVTLLGSEKTLSAALGKLTVC